MKLAIFLAAIAACLFGSSSAAPDKVVCYFASWATYRTELGKFDVENIDPTLCTHLVYTFVGIGGDGSVKVLDPWNDLEEDWGLGAFKRFVNLKNKAPGVKTLVAVGGWKEGAATFSKVAASDSLRAQFVQNALSFVQKYSFDGFDLDWEYPSNADQGGNPEDLKNFSKLVKELRAAFNPHGLLLTAAVAAAETAFPNYYEVPELSKYLDFINVMAYDYHGSWEQTTGINAPLNPSQIDVNPALNIKASIEAWIRHGADPKKIVLGMGTYGRSYTLVNSEIHGIGAPIFGAGEPGKYTKEAGMLGYNEIAELIRDGQWTVDWQEQQKVPFAYQGTQWVGYDNVKSIKLKCEWAKEMGLGGGMIWSIDTDDFLGVSGTKFPLLKTINNVFGRIV